MLFITLGLSKYAMQQEKVTSDVAGRTSQLSYTAASRLICVTRVALPEKPGKVSFVCIFCRAVLYCDGCGLAVWPYITGHSKTVLYGEYSTGGAFESPTQSTIIIHINPINVYILYFCSILVFITFMLFSII